METYTLYHFDSCPFCVRVRRFLSDQHIEMPMKDVLRDPEAYRELIAGGGDAQVPCLRIQRGDEVRWLYESLDIIDYLRRARAPEGVATAGE